ncbi:hypothetical protein [Celerinatantimonas yamalensis]|uniref:Uncharacterized protein n=1 Tax=Celerinatantimonas yamalensis TaxID=559956 RepID=A0ABW9G927_9GAMM
MSSRIIGKIDLTMYSELSKETEYLNSIPKNNEEYDEFGQGYWKNLSLYNSSGRHDDSQYKESKSCSLLAI